MFGTLKAENDEPLVLIFLLSAANDRLVRVLRRRIICLCP